MLDEEVKELRKGISDILVAIARLDEQMKSLAAMSTQLQETVVKVAHLERDTDRLVTKHDNLAKQVDNIERDIKEERDGSKEDRKWLLGAFFGAAALVLTIMNYFREVSP